MKLGFFNHIEDPFVVIFQSIIKVINHEFSFYLIVNTKDILLILVKIFMNIGGDLRDLDHMAM